MKQKAIFCWSGGKDSSLCLYRVLQEDKYEVKYLLTTLNENVRRVSMHGVREELLDEQAKAIGIPLIKMFVKEGTNTEYETRMGELLKKLKLEEQIEVSVFGDIFLEDLRAYRVRNLEKVGMKGVFPLWKSDTRELMNEFSKLKFKTITCCVNDAYLDEKSVGVMVDEKFISGLPSNVDPCGENGEFHTFCFEGPIFKNKIRIKIGDKIYKPLEIKDLENKITTKGFWYCDILKE